MSEGEASLNSVEMNMMRVSVCLPQPCLGRQNNKLRHVCVALKHLETLGFPRRRQVPTHLHHHPPTTTSLPNINLVS